MKNNIERQINWSKMFSTWSKIYSEPEKQSILGYLKNIIRNWMSKRSVNKSFKRMVRAAERLDNGGLENEK